KPPKTHLFIRGDFRQPGIEVRPNTLAALPSLPADAVPTRLRLARRLVSKDNPLTARVALNRMWQEFFGRGLVESSEDFGTRGSRPTHPELLDWLAAEFVGSGWSLKHVHRLIVRSATYRQSSAANDRGLAADAQSRLLWQYPPRRLEAEAIRDAILAVSGALDRRMGGPGFDLFEPNDNYVKVYTPKRTFGPAEWRRLVYQTRPRMRPDGTFGAVDCPDAGQTAPTRTRSTTPLQALNLLNSPFVTQQAELFAERLRRGVGDDAGAQGDRGFALAF